MGNKIITFNEEKLGDYQDCTYFTRKEILRILKKFNTLCPNNISGEESGTLKAPKEKLEKLPELRENPFKTRICEVFSNDGKGDLTFNDFLDMLSVFSEQAPRDIKVFYAFKIYDFDSDDHIGTDDICTALKLLTRNELNTDEMLQISEKIMEEGDVDGDGKLSFIEFNHVILRAPDFLSTFHIRI